jgi:hypothetical protein
MGCTVIVNSPSCEVNLLRSYWTVVVSGGDPTDQWVVPFEVREVSIGLSRNNSDSSATAGIRAVGLSLWLQLLLQSDFRIKFAQQMILQQALDPLRLCLERKALGMYMGNIRWLLEYVYMYR